MNSRGDFRFLTAFLVAGTLASPILATTTAASAATARPAVSFSVSAPLYSIVPIPGIAADDPANSAEADAEFGPALEVPANFPIPRDRAGAAALVPPALRPENRTDRPVPGKNYYEAPMPGLLAGWNGLNQGVNRALNGFSILPPDTNGSASMNHYIQTVNTAFIVWDLTRKSPFTGLPAATYGPARISSIWAGAGGACEIWDDGDPIVLYDKAADRWIITQFALENFPHPPFSECIAVSATGDPLGPWNRYTYEFPVMNDYPHFGVWPDGYYLSINQFAPAEHPSWRGQGVAVFERDRMLAGDPAARMIYFDTSADCVGGTEPECALGGMLPSDLDGPAPPAGTPNFFMQFDDDANGFPVDQLQIWSFATDWAGGTGTFTHTADLPVNPFDSMVCEDDARSCIPQPVTAQGLDAIADRLMYRLQYRNFGDHQSLLANHTVNANPVTDPVTRNGHAGIRWYELRNAGAGWSVYQQGDHAPPDDASRWMGSIAMDKDGNIALGYSVSDDSAIYPGIRYAGRLTADPLNTLPLGENTMVDGSGYQSHSAARWGDYSSMSLAPDDCTFFYTNQFNRVDSSAEWYTYVGVFGYPSCTPVDTFFLSTPGALTRKSSAAFTLSGSAGAGDRSIVEFECSLDGAAFAPCANVVRLSNLAYGPHTFRARAADDLGNVDATPAAFTWVRHQTRSFRGRKADGWILESGEETSAGGSMNRAAATLIVGDDALDQQYRSILTFNTAALPDRAVIVGGSLRLKRRATVGTNPFTTHGTLTAGIGTPIFGSTVRLRNTDFQEPAGAPAVAAFDATPDANWYTGVLTGGFEFVNKEGATQFRLAFTADDDDDGTTDQTLFFSGNAGTTANRPRLVLDYYVP